jgi:hypothetical protein
MVKYDRPKIIENYYTAATALMNIGTADNIPEELSNLTLQASIATTKIIDYINTHSEPKLIKTWVELAECESETHILKINLEYCNGWIIPKMITGTIDPLNDHHYLSTHTFYGSSYEWSTKILQECGFNVQLANWNEEGVK